MTKLSVYDFDKTIYNGETLNDFYRFYLNKKTLENLYCNLSVMVIFCYMY